MSLFIRMNSSELMLPAVMTSLRWCSIWSRSRHVGSLHRINQKYTIHPEDSTKFQPASSLQSRTLNKYQHSKGLHWSLRRDFSLKILSSSHGRFCPSRYNHKSLDSHTILDSSRILVHPPTQSQSGLHTASSLPRSSCCSVSQKTERLCRIHLHTNSLNLRVSNKLLTPSGISCLHVGQFRSNLHTSSCRLKLLPFNLADIGEGIREVIIKEWNPEVKVGAKIEEFDVLCEVESDKASVTITSRYSGIVTKVYHREGDVALVGKPLIEIEVDGLIEVEQEESKESSGVSDACKYTDAGGQATDKREASQTTCDKTEANSISESVESLESKRSISGESQENRCYQEQTAERFPYQPVRLNRNKWKILATPAVRRMIKQYDIDTKHLRGTGKQGRVLKEDIITYMNSPVVDESRSDSRQLSETGQALNFSARSVSEANKTPSVIPIRGYVRGMFKSMTESNAIPTLRLTEEVDTTQLKTVRTELSETYREHFGLKVTYMPFFIKALSLCLAEYPLLNASIDSGAENILVNAHHNICIAIDTKHGLVVPNIKEVNKLSIGNIAHELNRLQSSAHEGKVPPSDLQGGTIAMSNVGNVGGVLVQPIVMPRQVSIVAFGRMVVLPRFDPVGSVVPRSVLNVTWAADHRVVDGATVARAATLFKSLVENPLLLLAS